MSFVEKMRKSMKELEEACKENTEWNKCIYECPFTEYCTALMDAGLFDPMVGAFFEELVD